MNEIKMNWSKYVNGTVKGTVFENDNWVEELCELDSPVKASNFFNGRFKNKWEMSINVIPSIIEKNNRPWEERYAMIQLFRIHGHVFINISMKLEEIKHLMLDYYRYDNRIPRNKQFSFSTELTRNGNIAVLTDLPPAHPDGDREYIFRVYSPAGKHLTEWGSGSKPLEGTKYFSWLEEY